MAIAGVLAMDPEIVILNEPTAGLGPYFSKQIMQVLDQIHQQKKTIILSTHDVNLAYQWADEIIVMHDGEILGHAPPGTVFERDDWLEKAHLRNRGLWKLFNSCLNSQALLDVKS